MAIKDILLPLVGCVKPPSCEAIRKCAMIGGYIGAHISAIGVEVDAQVSPMAFRLSEHFDDVRTLERASERLDAQGLLKVFSTAADEAGVRNDQTFVRRALDGVPAFLANCARLKDLSLLPLKADDITAVKVLEALIFASGRPALVFAEETADRLSNCFDHAAIAWNHSQQAARAVADALPLLQRAKNVRIFTATDRVTAGETESGAALVRHLAEHNVAAVFETAKIDGSSVGKVFDAYVKTNKIDLLVMGAYGHSWLKEFIWGGATKTVLGSPPCWVLMSH